YKIEFTLSVNQIICIFVVKISFADRKLEKLSRDYNMCRHKMGVTRAKLFMKRLNMLSDARTLEDVRHLPGNFHELTGDRKGQWACSLDQPYRLVFAPREYPAPTKEGRAKIQGIAVIEIINYHKEK